MRLKKFKQVKRLLINVDMVNGFINEGAMSDYGIASIVQNQKELIANCNAENDYLIFVKEGHNENCTEFEKFPAHCVKGTKEAEIIDELQEFANKGNTYEKNCTSAVFAKNLLRDITKMVNLQEVIIMGCCTDICILNLALPLVNYFDQLNKNISVCVPKNTVETYNADFHNRQEYNEIAFKLMKQAGVNVVDKYNQKTEEQSK